MSGFATFGFWPSRIGLGEPRAVALVAQVAGELVDEQAAVREDQDAEGAAGLDEARRGDRLPRSGRVAEAEAAHGAGVLALELGLVRLLVERVRRGPARPRARRPARPRGSAGARCPLPLVSAAVSSWSAISSVSIPASASTWWRRSSVPEASEGVSWPSTRSSPSMRPQSTFHRGDGAVSPASISASAASSARRRAVPGARPVAGSSLGRRNGSPAQPSARWAASARASSASGVIVDCSVVVCIAAAPGGAAVPTEEIAARGAQPLSTSVHPQHNRRNGCLYA